MKIKLSGYVRAENVTFKDVPPIDEYLIALEAPEDQDPDFLLNEDGSTPVLAITE
jgi:hypothetical protein